MARPTASGFKTASADRGPQEIHALPPQSAEKRVDRLPAPGVSMRRLPLLLVLSACTGKAPSSGGESPPAETGSPSAAPDTGADTADPVREPPTYSQGSCPTFEDGMVQDFPHEGGAHDFRLILPPDPQGAPVLYAWHWLGGTARDIVNSMELDDLAQEQGVIVVAPNSAGNPYEWDFLGPPEGNADLALFRDSLACLHSQFGVDLARIWTTGMSAGGLWTTYLTMHGSEWLAASAPLSGGTFPGTYVSPTDPLPVMVTWGGPTDWYRTDVHFEETSLHFSESLRADGHFVVHCVHDRGHTLPPDASTLVWTFLSAHTKDAPSPWTGGLPSDMPTWCEIP